MRIIVGDGLDASMDTYLLDINVLLVRTVKSEHSAVGIRATLTKLETPAGPNPLVLPLLQLAHPYRELAKRLRYGEAAIKVQGDLYQMPNGPKFLVGRQPA